MGGSPPFFITDWKVNIMHLTKVVKVGNGFYINIGIVYANRFSLKKGDPVAVRLTEQGLLISPIKFSQEGGQDEVKQNSNTDD